MAGSTGLNGQPLFCTFNSGRKENWKKTFTDFHPDIYSFLASVATSFDFKQFYFVTLA